MDVAIQIWIAVCGLGAVGLLMRPNPKAQKFGPMVGLLGQPAWLYATFQGEQWGMWVLCLAYTALYAHGTWRVLAK